ncbi:MAG: BsuPI-related putative proteinase inhibitor [Dehalococcoidales bacterium]|nr:BsuPI-related putative proteinase inhibitor [Dehalococcoidales bacterium]
MSLMTGKRLAKATTVGLCLALLGLALAGCTQNEATAKPGQSPGTPTPTGTPKLDQPNFAEGTALREIKADLDGDGKEELVTLTASGATPERLSADSLEASIFVPSESGYSLAWQSEKLAGERAEPLEAKDINGDGRPEVLSVQAVGAAGETLYVFAWLGQGYGTLTPHGGEFDGKPSFGVTGVNVKDVDGDGTLEILAYSGGAAAKTAVYKWDGKAYSCQSNLSDAGQGVLPAAQVEGTVVSTSPSAKIVEVAPVSGPSRTIALQPTTEIRHDDGKLATLQDIQPGMCLQATGSPGRSNSILAEVVTIMGKSASPGPTTGVKVALQTGRSDYAPGDSVKFTVTVRNDGSAPAALQFNSGQRFDIVVLDTRGNEVWKWSDGMFFTMALGTLELQPGESKSFDATWDQKDGKGNQVSAGHYVAQGWITAQGLNAQGTAEFAIGEPGQPSK